MCFMISPTPIGVGGGAKAGLKRETRGGRGFAKAVNGDLKEGDAILTITIHSGFEQSLQL